MSCVESSAIKLRHLFAEQAAATLCISNELRVSNVILEISDNFEQCSMQLV